MGEHLQAERCATDAVACKGVACFPMRTYSPLCRHIECSSSLCKSCTSVSPHMERFDGPHAPTIVANALHNYYTRVFILKSSVVGNVLDTALELWHWLVYLKQS